MNNSLGSKLQINSMYFIGNRSGTRDIFESASNKKYLQVVVVWKPYRQKDQVSSVLVFGYFVVVVVLFVVLFVLLQSFIRTYIFPIRRIPYIIQLGDIYHARTHAQTNKQTHARISNVRKSKKYSPAVLKCCSKK